MTKTYIYKLKNKNSYFGKYERWLGIYRFVYNLAKETKDYAYTKQIYLSKNDLSRQLTKCKNSEGYEWLKEIGGHTLQAVLERLDDSYTRYFKKLKNGEVSKGKLQYINKKQNISSVVSVNKLKNFGKPKWAKKDKFQTLIFKQGDVTKTNPMGSLRQTEKGFKLPKFGEVKVFNNKRKIDGKIKQARLTKKAGNLYLHVVAEELPIERKRESQSICAIDMGIKNFYVTSDGEHQENPKHLFKYLKQLRVENRSLSRKVEGSSGWSRQVLKLQKLHLKIDRTREDFLHKRSTHLANKYDYIVREDLDIQGMVRDKKFSKHISDCSWSKFFKYLEYKSYVVKVNPAYTSQECSKCGHTCKENRTTQSLFKCLRCGHAANADEQACLNILERGQSLLYANASH